MERAMESKNAEYAEIATYLRGRFRPLNGPDDQAYAQLNTVQAGPSQEEFLAASPLPDAVNKFLLQLDAKVDALLAAMCTSSMEQDFPHTMEIHSISASKLHFTTSAPLAPGDWLESIVFFRQSGFDTASGIGKVTARKVDKDGTPFFELSFTRIHEEEREKIIRFVFKEERRLLRETRLE
ncbi:putative Type IV pilus assembly PilZ [uncultured delta proteobacterium]|uniref:Putative Type IV pilus assembly PilZ n=1 Tax=uncultured delta proteobacterium TaxID=34034 RepID=A0A212IWB8_9DELT|nr:putative Type IV pilus assembly PilZ [uncultured delta proteobacterium]